MLISLLGRWLVRVVSRYATRSMERAHVDDMVIRFARTLNRRQYQELLCPGPWAATQWLEHQPHDVRRRRQITADPGLLSGGRSRAETPAVGCFYCKSVPSQ